MPPSRYGGVAVPVRVAVRPSSEAVSWSASSPSAAFAALVTLGLVHAPTIVMPGVFIVVLAMGYELGWDMIAAAQLAAQLRASEQRFRAVVEAVPSAILLVDDKGMITLANAQAETVFGYRRAELIAKPVEMLIPERFRVPHVGLRQRLRQRRAGAGDGGRTRAVRVPQGRQRNPGGGRAQSYADRARDCSYWRRSSTSQSAGTSSGQRPASATNSRTCRESRCWASCPDRSRTNSTNR